MKKKPEPLSAAKPEPPITDAAIALGFSRVGPYHWQMKLERDQGAPVMVDYYPTTGKLVLEGQTFQLSWKLAARYITRRARELKGL